MKLLLENWREYITEFNPTGRQEGEIYIKSLPLDNPDLPAYTRAVGQDIRGVAKVFDVQGGEIKMEYIVPYSNSKGIYDIDNDLNGIFRTKTPSCPSSSSNSSSPWRISIGRKFNSSFKY